jgi:hypothetical protein
MPLDDPNIIPQPDGDIEDRFPRAGQEARVGVAHDVGCHPFAALCFHVVLKGALEVVTIQAFAFLNLGMEHVGFKQPVGFQERNKLIRERQASFLAVLKLNPFVLPQVQLPVWDVEPERPGFDDLIFPQPAMEAAEEDILQIIPWAFVYQLFHKLGSAEVAPCLGRDARQLKPLARVVAPDVLHVHAPSEERPNSGEVACGRIVSQPVVPLLVVEVLHDPLCDAGDFTASNEPGELHQDRPLRFAACLSVTFEEPLVCEVGINQVAKRTLGNVEGRTIDLRRESDSFGQVASAEGFDFSDSVDLLGKAIETVLPTVQAGEMFHTMNRVTAGLHLQANNPLPAVPTESTFADSLGKWCAMQGLNLRPLPCQDTSLEAESNTFRVALRPRFPLHFCP